MTNTQLIERLRAGAGGQHEEAAAELERLSTKIEALGDVLHELACLGNGNRYGTSSGNQIAIAALAKYSLDWPDMTSTKD